MGDTPALAKNIHRLRAEIASWRQERHDRAPLPENLWAEAVEIARHVGVNQARLALGLSYTALQAHVRGGAGERTQFVEFSGAEVLAAGLSTTSGATIEISGRDGVQVVVRIFDVNGLDVAALVDAVRGRA